MPDAAPQAPQAPAPDKDRKPLPAAAADALATLAALSGEDADAFAEAVAQDTPKALRPLRSRFFAAGKKDEGKATERAQGEIERLTARVAELEAATQAAPDQKARDEAWQRRLDERTRERDDAKAAAETIRDEIDAEKLENALNAVSLRPTARRLARHEWAGRVTRAADGSYELRDEAGIPIPVPAGKTVWQVAAEQAYEAASPDDRVTNADPGGGGVGAGPALGRVGALTDDQRYQRQRKDPMYAGIRSGLT